MPKKPSPKSSPAARRTAELVAKGKKYYTQNYKPREMIIDRAKGSRVWDLEGNEYVDFGAGIAVVSLGHCNPALVRAMGAQAQKIWHTSNIFYTEPTVLLAEELVKASKFASRVFFCNSGGEANEAAIKLARKYAADKGRPPEKREIISFTGSFHGRTMATVTATAQPKYHAGFEPLPPGFRYCTFNDFDAIAQMMSDSVCAIITEVVQGEGGITPAMPGFLAHLRALCDKHDALLILDQVQDGMGRTGHLFSHFAEKGLQPDVVTLAKGLGGGIPIGAALVAPKVAEVFQFGSHGTTFGGNPLSAAIARAALKLLQSSEVSANVKARGKQLIKGLEDIGREFDLFKEVRGRGLMIGAELKEPHAGKAGDFSEACRKAGVLVLQAGPNVLRFVPALTIREKDIVDGLKRMRKAVAGMAK
jgi:acetylornithine/N-succinyldiaminopimelate aminotransferase